MYKLVSWLYKNLYGFEKKLHTVNRKLNYIKYKIEFGEREDDIYVASFPKSGTTLTQMIIYQLTTDGNIDFNHIYDVSPWTQNEAYRHKSPKNLPSPRIIKTHDYYYDYDKSTLGRFIYVFRDGMDVAVSLYHQKKNYGNPNLTFNDFLPELFGGGKTNWFRFNRDWLENKNNLPILYLTYTDLTKNFDETMERIVSFLNLDRSKIDFARVKEHCSFDFMKKHQDKFGEQPVEKPVMVYDQFIRKGKSGEGIETFNEKQKQIYQFAYSKFIKPFENKLNL
jgi:hypothetical protein